jgi:anaerobic dimethyl sulfoxide reductase subunit B (iron-sulfur subunit)
LKKEIILVANLCSGCGACVVACMDENDIYPEKGQPAFRLVSKVEEGRFPDAVIRYVSAGCRHCADSPCAAACPTGAITKNPDNGAVLVNRELCTGCHNCAPACPFGVPRYDADGRMLKCDLCVDRLAAGLEPACVRVCPLGALRFGPAQELTEQTERKFAG